MQSVRSSIRPRRFMRHWALVLTLGAIGGILGAGAAAQDDAERAARYAEEDVKAAFLFHFATYVQWPVQEDDPSITFAVMSAPAVADRLEEFTRGRRVGDQTVEVVRIESSRELGNGVEVLYIGPNENARLAQLLARLNGPTLLVTDVPGEAPDGSMINFQVVDRRVRFEIALATAERAGLTLSSRLLGAAWRVRTTQCHGACWELDVDKALSGFRIAYQGEFQNLHSNRASTLRSISFPSPYSG